MPSVDRSDLSALLEPQSIAIIGASGKPEKIGGRPLEALLRLKYPGQVYPVNGSGGLVQGHPAFRSIEDVPGPVDLAIVALPREAVLEAVEACARKNVRVVVLFSAGFAEVGAEGAAEQARLVEIARQAGMRLLGPNCMGAANLLKGVTATFSAASRVQRSNDIRQVPRVPLVSQSGAVGGHAVTMATRRGFAFDPWVTTGNQSDIDVADCVEHFVRAGNVPAIAVYVEGVEDGGRLDRALRLARANKIPVVLLKAGSSSAGEAAAASHTAALTGSDSAYQALFDAHDVVRVHTIAELLDSSYALAVSSPPKGSRVLALTISGGVGIVMADRASVHGLELPPMSPEGQHQLKTIWPLAGVNNPVDTTAQVLNQPGLMPELFNLALDSGDYDAAAVFLSYLPLMDATKELVISAMQAIREAHPELPIYASLVATDEARNSVESLGIPVFEEPDDMLSTLAGVARFGAALGTDPDAVVSITGSKVTVARGTSLTEHEALELLGSAGVPVVGSWVASDEAEATSAAEKFGYPVVLKVSSPDVTHKSDVGGVRLCLPDGESVATAYRDIVASVSTHAPAAKIDGVVVAPMVSGGIEMLLGVSSDPILGPHVVVGLGGVHVEILGDVAIRRAPVNHDQAREMVGEIRGRSLLEGARGAPPADIDALVEAIVALGQFAAANVGVIESVDINPFLVLPDGQGGVAVDAVVVTRASSETDDESSPHPTSPV